MVVGWSLLRVFVAVEENKQLQEHMPGGVGGIAFPHLRIEIGGTR
jgi:hypothetical protein